MSDLRADFVWRQTILVQFLRCPRRVYLEHVLELPPDHSLDGYASVSGAAIHVALAQVLGGVQAGRVPSRDELAAILTDAFCAELEKVQDKGATTDPERVEAALDRLQGEQLDLVVAFAEDPRIRAIDWQGIEERFDFADAYGRRFTGTIDAWGVARELVRLGVSGKGEPTWVSPGELCVVDWKTGTELELDWVSRALNVQLGLYGSTLGEDARCFLGVLRDLARPKRPTDAQGESIPRTLREVNPAWAEAVGVDPNDQAAIEACRKRPKNVGPKWLERDNPAWIEATSRPKGPLFHECRIDQALVAQTIADVIDAARFGLWPAAGAATGECGRCPFRARCAHQGSP